MQQRTEPGETSPVETQNGRQNKPPGSPRLRSPRKPDDLFFNRELSWLDFNARVLDEAINPGNPLLERLKFLAIFGSNLDEFFMIYVSGMRDRADEITGRPRTERAVRESLRAIKARLEPLLALQSRCLQELLPQLARHGICLMTYAELSDDEKQWIRTYFENEVFPVLTPLAVDPGHPFPYISNLSLSLAVVVHDPFTGQDRFARIKVPEPRVLPRFVAVPPAVHKFVLLEEIVAAHLGRLFPGMEIKESYPFRVTRDADLELREDGAADLMEMIEEELPKRRFGEIERLELVRAMPSSLRATVIEELSVPDEEVYTVDGPLNLADLMALTSIDMPELHDPAFVPAVPPALRNVADIFSVIRQKDVMLHHPYQSFGCVIDFLCQAAADPNVLTIKHTLYRTSGDSPILAALIEAAQNNKQVACLVELKARFDEANNITWAKQLEKYGVHVVYGLMGLKTHCKTTLVVRREEDGLRRYLHVGTGNYNPKTAATYTDIGILTCDEEFGADATELFNYLTGWSHQDEYRAFLVAPVTLRRRIDELIHREVAQHRPDKPGRIIAKMNALVDPALIKALYAASTAGVEIDLIVRGMCCLRPGIPGLSENIRVISIVGRFLEHSRIFYFQNGGDEEVYIGSADWMPRNLDRRVEVVVPVRNSALRKQLVDDVLRVYLRDNCQVWELQPNGCYVRRRPVPGQHRFSSQAVLLESLTYQSETSQ
jgi:polyphosphate kinase